MIKGIIIIRHKYYYLLRDILNFPQDENVHRYVFEILFHFSKENQQSFIYNCLFVLIDRLIQTIQN